MNLNDFHEILFNKIGNGLEKGRKEIHDEKKNKGKKEFDSI